MRKKRGTSNQRKKLWFPGVRRRHQGGDETEWIILEADLTSGSAAASRRKSHRAKTWAIRGLALLCLSASVPFGVKWVNNAIFFENDQFILTELNFQSDGVLTVANLSEVSNVSVGMKLLELDLDLIRERIEKLPVVEEAVVSREMPDKLNILVKERIPVAWISCPPLGVRPCDMERGFLIDEEGYLFRCLDLTEGIEALPIIESFAMADPVEGTQLTDDGIAGAIRLVVESGGLSENDAMGVHLVRLRNEWSLQCRYRNGLQVVFAIHDLDRGVSDLALIVKQASLMGQHLATVDVSMSDNIPATFAGPVNPGGISAVAQPVGTTDYQDHSAPMDDQEKHLRSILNGG